MIIMDSREDEKLKKYFGEEEVTVEALPVGDYFCKEKNIIIERKTIGDFIQSYISGHLPEQCEQLAENFETYYLFISGHYNYFAVKDMPYKHYTEKSFNKSKLHLLHSFPGLRIVEFANDRQLIEGIIEMSNYTGSARHKELVRRQATKEDCYLSILMAVRGISLRKAKAVALKYNDIRKLQTALEESTDKSTFFIKEINKSDYSQLKEAFCPGIAIP
jgi:ERCC4-type nuclease